MSGQAIFELLCQMAIRGDDAREREDALARLAEKEGCSSDTLRARARRYAKKAGYAYPLMREPPGRFRSEQAEARQRAREAAYERRLRVGAEALARGADWGEIAKLFGIDTPEGAAMWWRRNQPGTVERRRPGRKPKPKAD